MTTTNNITRINTMRSFIGKLLMYVFIVLSPIESYGHPDKATHANEIMTVLGFEYNQSLYEWLCFISSDMIDKHQPFYSELCSKFPDFKCKHRLLFHWNYNGIPWTPSLEARVLAYTRMKYGSENYRKEFPAMKEAFLNVLRKEQKSRNSKINTRTEQLFSFASGGKDASYANFFAAMAYDLHILGDYTSIDNTDLDGLVDFKVLINGIISSINRLDPKEGKSLIKKLRTASSNPNKNVQYMADDAMAILQSDLPLFIMNAEDGSIKRRLEKHGFKFIEISFMQKLKKYRQKIW